MEKQYLSTLELENLISSLRAHMINLGILKGFNHPETIKCSQELDVALNLFQNIGSNDKQNKKPVTMG